MPAVGLATFWAAVALTGGCGPDRAPVNDENTEGEAMGESSCADGQGCTEDPSALDTDSSDPTAGEPPPQCAFAEDCIAGLACDEGICVELQTVETCDRLQFSEPEVLAESLGDVEVVGVLEADADGSKELLLKMADGTVQVLDGLRAETSRTVVPVDPWVEIDEFLPVDLDGDGDDDLVLREASFSEGGDLFVFEALGDGNYVLSNEVAGDGSDFEVGDLRGDGGIDLAGPFVDGVHLLRSSGTSVGLSSERLFARTHLAVAIGRLNDDSFDDLVAFGDGAVSVYFGGSGFPSNHERLTQGSIGRRALVAGTLGLDARLLSLTERGGDYLVEVWPSRPNSGSWTARRWSLPTDMSPATFTHGTVLQFEADRDPGVWLTGQQSQAGLLLDVGSDAMCLQSPPPDLTRAAVGDFDGDGDDDWVYVRAGTIWARGAG